MNPSYLGTERTSTSYLLDSFPLWIETDLIGVPAPTASGGKSLVKHGPKDELTLAGVPKTSGSCTFVLIRSSEERPFSSPHQVLSACQALENSRHLIVVEHSHRNLRAIYYLITFLPLLCCLMQQKLIVHCTTPNVMYDFWSQSQKTSVRALYCQIKVACFLLDRESKARMPLSAGFTSSFCQVNYITFFKTTYYFRRTLRL